MAAFNYNAGAGLYPCKNWKRTSRLGYKRFETVAEALRFAIEEMPASLLRGSILEVEEARFDSTQIQRLYEAGEYPLPRRDQ
jgi:hypothetical protein